MSDVAHDADDFHPPLRRAEADPFADRIVSRPVSPDGSFIDNHDIWRSVIALSELAAANQWNSHRAEIIRRYQSRMRPDRSARFERAVFELEVQSRILSTERQRRRCRDCLHPRYHAQPGVKFLIELNGLRAGITAR